MPSVYLSSNLLLIASQVVRLRVAQEVGRISSPSTTAPGVQMWYTLGFASLKFPFAFCVLT